MANLNEQLTRMKSIMGIDEAAQKSDKEDFRAVLKTLLSKPNVGIAAMILGKEEKISETKEAFTYTYRGTLKKTVSVDVAVYRSKNGIRYIALDDGLIIAAAFINSENEMTGIITEPGFENVGIGTNLLNFIKQQIPNMKVSGVVSKQGQKLLSRTNTSLTETDTLDEAAKTTSDLAQDTALYIDTTVDESIILLLHSVTYQITYAHAQIRQIDEDTYSVKTMSAESGYGPLMYDIVFSYIYPKCLMPDRNGQVSQEAWAVWEYYFNKRNDIKKTSLQPRDKLFNTAITHGSKAYLSPEEVEYLEAHNGIDKNVLKIYNTKYQGKPVDIAGLLQNAKAKPKDKEGTIALAIKHFRHNYMR